MLWKHSQETAQGPRHMSLSKSQNVLLNRALFRTFHSNKCHMLAPFKLLVREPDSLFHKAPPAGLQEVRITHLSISLGSFVNLNTKNHTTFTMAGKPPTEEGLMKASRRENLKTPPDQRGQV